MGNLTQKKKDSVTRTEQRNNRSAVEQLALLDQRLGVNVGAHKERNRLAREISKAA